MAIRWHEGRLCISLNIPVTTEEMECFVGHYKEFVKKCDTDGPVPMEDFVSHLLEPTDVFNYEEKRNDGKEG